MTAPRMPVQLPHRPRDAWAGSPTSVPWSVVEGHESQAMSNHGQTLARLAERGGLAPDELYAVVHDTRWQPSPLPVPELKAWLRDKSSPGADR